MSAGFLAVCAIVAGGRAAEPSKDRWEGLDKRTGSFVLSLAEDRRGRVWVGTEDKGVFRYDPAAPANEQWRSFAGKDGPGDGNAYAVAVDRLDRVWVGTLNHGVAVFNGESWKTYGPLTGPLGERVFAIATCPTDGDVWAATNAGLSRYSLKDNDWSYVTRDDGLPEDQASALAFDAQGTLYVGTQCHGVAVARAADGYKTWAVADGPWGLPVAPAGSGLPSNLINDILVARDGTVYVATDRGLAWSKDRGRTWRHARGRDYAAKVKGALGGPPKGWKEPPKTVLDKLLPEDYVTCLAEDRLGLIWLGFRQQGYLALRPKTMMIEHRGGPKADGLPDEYVRAILVPQDARPVVATYGGGLARAREPMLPRKVTPPEAAATHATPTVAPLPREAKPPTPERLKEMLAHVQALPGMPLTGAYLGEDWTTQGDWVGRYGRQAATLCAMTAPLDHEYGWDADFRIDGKIGPHRTKDDALRHWVHWLKTDNPRSLYTPCAGYRRQSEWDDHGEAYPQTHEGPDLWVAVQIPKGTYRLGFYVMNKDGHEGKNRFRDYLMEMHGPAKGWDAGYRAPVVSRTRIKDFWGGVYKNWMVTGPGRYYTRIAKNGSHNTILSAVTIDRVVGPDQPWDNSWLPFMETVRYDPPAAPKREDLLPALMPVADLWEQVRKAQAFRRGVPMVVPYRTLLYRTAVVESAPPQLLEAWRWAIPLWTDEDRAEWKKTMRRAWAVREEIARTGILPQK